MAATDEAFSFNVKLCSSAKQSNQVKYGEPIGRCEIFLQAGNTCSRACSSILTSPSVGNARGYEE